MTDSKPKITKLSELLSALDSDEPQSYTALVPLLDIPATELELFASYSHEKYTRNCIKRTAEYELVLLGWEAYQETPIHYHDQQECWVHVVKGEFSEKRYKWDVQNKDIELLNETVPESGDTTYMHDSLGMHKLANVSAHRALSLHLYVGPIDSCKCYLEGQSKFEEVTLEYDSVAEFT